jgi:hypothetical protein
MKYVSKGLYIMTLICWEESDMNKELNSKSDLAKAYLGKYEGSEINLRRISNDVKARRGEYEGFGIYLRKISGEAKARRGIL